MHRQVGAGVLLVSLFGIQRLRLRFDATDAIDQGADYLGRCLLGRRLVLDDLDSTAIRWIGERSALLG